MLAALANFATIVGFVIGLGALWYAFVAYQHSRTATSAATFLTLSEAFHQAWSALFALPSGDLTYNYHFAHVANLIEAGCALHFEKVLSGRSGKMLQNYLVEIIELIEADSTNAQRLECLVSATTTFNNLLTFRDEYVRNRALK